MIAEAMESADRIPLSADEVPIRVCTVTLRHLIDIGLWSEDIRAARIYRSRDTDVSFGALFKHFFLNA